MMIQMNKAIIKSQKKSSDTQAPPWFFRRKAMRLCYGMNFSQSEITYEEGQHQTTNSNSEMLMKMLKRSFSLIINDKQTLTYELK